jgi:hypothetical protein
VKTSAQYFFNYWGVLQLQEEAAKGEALPPVDEGQLRQVWTVFPASPALNEQGHGFTADAWDVFDRVGPVTFVRAAALNNLLWSGELAPWQRGGRDLEDFVFQAAASFPFSNERQHNEFLQYLRDKHPTK